MQRLASFTFIVALAACGSTSPSAVSPPAGQDSDAAAFVRDTVKALKPLQLAVNQTWYAASVSGSDQDFAASKEAELALSRLLADPTRFATARKLREDATHSDPALKRQLELIYLSMLGKQVAPELLAQLTGLEKEVEQLFNTYRGTVDGKTMSQNEIVQILATSTDSAELRQAWEAQKAVGPLVAPKLLTLVELRNKVATQLGFRDFYAMRLAESELDETQLLTTFDELDRLTRAPFLEAKAVVDQRLSRRLSLPVAELMPWHYQNPFFQSPPDVFETGLDAIYKSSDTLKLCRDYFAGIGLPGDDILARSDLYEKPGKTPHAFETDIDREGDIRVLTNIVPGLNWQSVTVHELGHAVYDKYIDPELPWLLRQATHALTTEGMAMMFDRHVPNPRWAEAMGVMGASDRDAAMVEAHAYQAFAALQFSRWTQVMLRFEREMYRDPGQDLNALWWDLVERYQGLRRPDRMAPDYASKIHLVVAPVYYQNYMLGELFAAQVHEAVAAHLGQQARQTIYVGEPRVGEFLKERVFGPGALYRWDELTRRATGHPLSPEAFARRFSSN